MFRIQKDMWVVERSSLFFFGWIIPLTVLISVELGESPFNWSNRNN